MALSGSRYEDLLKALLSVFPEPEELERALAFIGVSLPRVASNGNLTDRMFDVIQWFEAEGRVHDLESQALKYRPHNEEMLAYAAKYFVEGAHVALSELASLAESPDVRRALVFFRSDFEEARDRLLELATLKRIHDQLHILQIGYFTQLVNCMPRFPDDEQARTNLKIQAIGLGSLIENLPELLGAHEFVGSFGPAMEDLREGHQALERALRERSNKEMQRAVRCIGKVLAAQPTILNSRMMATVELLRFSRLVSALATARERLPADAPHDLADKLASGAAAMRDLSECVTALMTYHDHWQYFDIQVARLATGLDVRTDELRDEWPSIKKRTDELRKGCNEKWAKDLAREVRALGKAIASNNDLEIRSAFQCYRHVEVERFFNVDVNLRNLCDRLVTINEPLNQTLGAL